MAFRPMLVQVTNLLSLFQVGADVRARDDGGLIPLHNACSFGHAEVVHLLLSAGADPNARDSWNYTPLHEAAIKGLCRFPDAKSFLNVRTAELSSFHMI